MESQPRQRRKTFTGCAISSIDKQRRILLPKEWRDINGNDPFFIIPTYNNVIKICDEVYYYKYLDWLEGLDDSEQKNLEILTVFGTSSIPDIKPDSQGRITLSERIMEHGNLAIGGKVALAGATFYGRIIDLDIYEAMMKNPGNNTQFQELDRQVNQAKRRSLGIIQ